MDMESSRRPFPRSNEPGLKKPRLNDGGGLNPNLNGRAFPQRPGGGATNPMLQRFRASDRDSESTYVPQPLQNQELVHQYRTALAELTFNSKPIITNLTIIAGESLHAAKAITGTICANIIEVPSEQKLPSLYLLDSIVKNIGRDYIKHFAARLPEVFCKAYRQVEPPIHQSMRHLFGTWKGVFPAQTLQMIEKELGFGTAANGSSSGVATSRPDSQSQRPGNSIHVNPKYLERQRLQQPTRTKGMISDLDGTIDDVERPDRVASIGAGRSWVDPPVKMTNFQRSTRDALSERFLDKNIGGEYDESDYDSDLPRSSILGSGRTSGNIIAQGHDKPWYGGATSIAEPTSQRNSFSKKHGLNYSAPKSANADPRLQTPQTIASRNKGGLCSSWKNSEEEEYMWDDINSGLTDHVTPDHSSNSRKERWISDDSEKLGFGVGSRKLKRVNDMDFATDIADQKDLSALGHRITPPWSLQESHVVDRLTSTGAPAISSVHSERYVSSLTGLSTSGDSSVARLGNRALMMSSRIGASSFGLPTTVSGANGAVGKQQQIQSVRAASPSGELLMHQHPPSPTSKVQHPRYLAEQDPAQAPPFPPELKASQILGTSDSRLHSQYTEDTLPIPTSNVRLGGVAKPHPQDLKALSSSVSAIQSRRQYPFRQQEDSTEPESMDQTQKPHTPHVSTSVMPSTVRDSISDLSNLLAAETAGRSSTSSLLAAVLKSGVLSNKPITGSQPNLNYDDKEKMPPQSGGQPPLPSGRPPTKAVLAGSKASPAPSLGHPSRGNSPTTSSTLPKVGHPPLPPGQPPSSQEGSSGAKDSNTVKNAKDPISSLLSSLVAKGLISASKSESTTLQPMDGQSQNLSMTTTSIVSPVSVPLKVPPSSQKEDVSLTEQVAKPSASLAQSTKTEERNLIGFEFKPDRIRELHPSVIDELFDDLPHTCSICGLRLKLKERLDRHLEWHALKTSRTDDSVKASRGWYTISTNWVTGNAGSSSALDSNNSNDMTGKSVLSNEPMVLADESQCVCVICGHSFEDFYCQESNVWMFKGAVYMTVPSADGEFGAAGSSVLNGPIVHPNCMDENSLEELGISPTRIKLEIDV